MLFAIIILAAIVVASIYVSRKTNKSTPTTVIAPSIHEEIAKTVEEAKSQSPIVDETPKVAPKTTPKVAPKMDAKPKTQAKPKAPKKKTVDA